MESLSNQKLVGDLYIEADVKRLIFDSSLRGVNVRSSNIKLPSQGNELQPTSFKAHRIINSTTDIEIITYRAYEPHIYMHRYIGQPCRAVLFSGRAS